MKLLHITPSVSRAYGGPTSSLVAYCRAAMTFNVDVSIIAPKPDPPDPWIRGELPDADIRVFENYGSGAFFAAPGLHDWLRRHGSAFDVVHVHGLLNPVSSLAARTCVKKNWPMAIRPFGTMSRYTFTHRRQAIKRVYTV